eukprot:3369218-Prymnesium_polylepis.1
MLIRRWERGHGTWIPQSFCRLRTMGGSKAKGKAAEKTVTVKDMVKAIKQNKPRELKKLLDMGGDPNAESGKGYGETLLIAAALTHAPSALIRTLVSARADVEKKD